MLNQLIMSFSSLEDKITDYEMLEGKFEELERKLSDIQEKNIQATETMSSVGRCRQRSKFSERADFLLLVYTDDETRLSFILLKEHYLSICPFSVRKNRRVRKNSIFHRLHDKLFHLHGPSHRKEAGE